MKNKVYLVKIEDVTEGIFSSFRNADIFCHQKKFHEYKNITVWIYVYDIDTDSPPKLVNWSKLIKEKI